MLALLTPCHDGMYHSNYVDLLNYAERSRRYMLMKSEYESCIARHRSKMASTFLTDPRFKDCQGYITIDADIGARDLRVLDRLASLPWDIDICSGVYCKKDGSGAIVVRGLTEDRHPVDPNIVRAECVPTGFTRFSRRVVQAVYDMKHVPNCRHEWRMVYDARIMESSLGLGYESEDYAFCLDAAKLGYKCWLDRAIRLNHRGFTTFNAY
jgi:hypothetical protein